MQADKTVLWSCVVLSTVSIPLGSFSLGLHVVAIFLAAIFGLVGREPVRYRNVSAILLFLLALTFHFAAASFLSLCEDLLQKSVLSFALFGVMFLCLIRLAARADSPPSSKSIRMLLSVIVISVVIEQIWLWVTGASKLIRPSGIYLEPSHLALSVIPLIVALMFSHEMHDRRWSWVSLLALLMLSGSATLFIVVALCLIASYIATTQRSISIVATARIFFVIGSLIFLIYFSPFWGAFDARLNGVFKTDFASNISSLVYVIGWQMTVDNFRTTDGLGLGFNRMGCTPRPSTDASEVLELMGLGAVNYNDGSFTFSKIVSELGIFGIVIWTGAAYLLFRMIVVRGRAIKAAPIYIALSVSAAMVLIFGGFIRGTTYFSGPFVLGLYFLLAHIVKPSEVSKVVTTL